ncbi:hypothetical protein J2T17_003396 [Paenibacillus mucilaginosus]|uniref:hypothetical protein n=1 Tax=Paenibacillus mucilaginosus TaxID=61624 RepID=UPI003D1F3E96
MALVKDSTSHKELEIMHQSIWRELQNREESFARQFLNREMEELLKGTREISIKSYLSVKEFLTAALAGISFVLIMTLIILQLP